MPKAFDRAGVGKLVPAGDGPVAPWTAVGPLQVEVTEVTATRPLDSKALPRYVLNLRVQWIPIVQIAQYQTPQLQRAVDAKDDMFVAGPAMSPTP